MHFTSSLLATVRRLLPAVYGISRAGVRVSLPCSPTLSFAVGDNACFVGQTRGKDFQICGVADGVEGWDKEGVDPGAFAKDLMDSCAKEVALYQVWKPVEVLAKGYKETLWVHSKTYGSSTACILTLDCTSSTLHSANLGDSGYRVVRGGEVMARSEEEVHYFNTPFQLGNPAPGFMAAIHSISDKPSSAMLSSVEVREGDVVLLATDGFFYNMYDAEVAQVIKEMKGCSEESVKETCAALVERVFEHSQDTTYLSPFAKEGSEALSWLYVGGKPDDITVLLAAVVDE